MAINLSCTRYWRTPDLLRFSRHHHLHKFSPILAALPSDLAGSTYCDRKCSLEEWRRPLGGSISSADQTPMVALGKFDALHRGHQALAIAAAQLGGAPWLVSFAGMAEVLNWPRRLPLVAPIDRRRVMKTWKEACGGKVPTECALPFAEVRSLSPEDFVTLLANDLKVGGVAVGSNYRFGYKAAGDAPLLQKLAPQYGLKVAIVDLIEHQGELEGEVVSSSWVREALADGDVATAEYCLGRPYRLIVQELHNTEIVDGTQNVQVRKLAANGYCNQPPADGRYKVKVHAVGAGEELRMVEEAQHGEVVVNEWGVELVECPTDVEIVPGGRLVLDFVAKLNL